MHLVAGFGVTSTLSRWVGIAGLAVALILAAGCASQSYMGISLLPGRSPAEVQELARAAQARDKRAQLELGIRFEKGRGVAAHLARAKRLYRDAAADSGGDLWVYMPPVVRGGSGRVERIHGGASSPGLVEARRRLAALDCLEKPNRSECENNP